VSIAKTSAENNIAKAMKTKKGLHSTKLVFRGNSLLFFITPYPFIVTLCPAYTGLINVNKIPYHPIFWTHQPKSGDSKITAIPKVTAIPQLPTNNKTTTKTYKSVFITSITQLHHICKYYF
jgi:hypothetical protein